MRTTGWCVVFAMTLVAQPAFPAPPSPIVAIACYADILPDCLTDVVGLVSEKFRAKYPYPHWKLVVFAESLEFDSIGVGYAFAGVSPVVKLPSGVAPTLFPIQRHYVSKTFARKPTDAQARASQAREVLKVAVRGLMDECASTPNCDLYIPYER